MDDIISVMEAANSVWPVLALAVLGVLMLIWKFGGQLIQLQHENLEASRKLARDIQTNHGSKNVGQAIDRIIEVVWDIQAKTDQNTLNIAALHEIVMPLATASRSIEKDMENGAN